MTKPTNFSERQLEIILDALNESAATVQHHLREQRDMDDAHHKDTDITCKVDHVALIQYYEKELEELQQLIREIEQVIKQ